MKQQLRTQMYRDTTTMSVTSFGCFGQIFALCVGTFIADFVYHFFIVSAILWHIFVENQKRLYLWEWLQNIVSNSASD